jgi:hypothetical protein
MEGIDLSAAGSTSLISSTRDGVVKIDKGKPKPSEKNLLQTSLTTANPRKTSWCDSRTSYLTIGTSTGYCFWLAFEYKILL